MKIKGAQESMTAQEIVSAAIIHTIVALCGFIASRGSVFERLLPFGLGFLSGCSVTYTPAAAIGVFIGYFVPAVGNGGFRYVAALFAILAIKLLVSNYKKIINNPIFLGSMAFLANIFTSAVSMSSGDMNFGDALTESLLCSITAFFIMKVFKFLSTEYSGASPDELVSLLIGSGILILGFESFDFFSISLGKVLAVFLILSSAKFGGAVAGVICGVILSFVMALGGMPSSIGLSFSIGGLMAGVFSAMGKYAQISVLMIFSFIGAMLTDDTNIVFTSLIESAIGSLLFVFLPSKVGIGLGKLFSSRPSCALPKGIKKSVTMRLELASNALRDVSQTVEQVSSELSRINSPDFSRVISAIEQDACAGCNLRVYCWEKRRESTVSAILEMTKAVKQGECSIENNVSDEFKDRCTRVSRVGNATYKRYSDYTSKIAAENRIDEVRSVVSDQFNGISDMLRDMADDFKRDEKFDNSMALNAAAALKNIDIRVQEAGCRIDKFGRMTLEFKLKKSPELVINKLQVMKLLSFVCEREFDVPNISESGGDIFIVLSEHPELKVDIGVEQISASGSNMCGDAYKYFNDGRGHFIMVLSDGMGTGGRAAVDGAMASGLMARLIKAGFGYNCSLRILNSSMLFKSTDESLATVDIASIDLFTGQTELYKAGAAPTIVRRSGKTGKAESTSLPAGILRDIGFDKATVKCKAGDIIILMSDGVTGMGTDWIRAEIETWRDGSAQELATHLCRCAKRRRNDNHEDDITVMAAILSKAI